MDMSSVELRQTAPGDFKVVIVGAGISGLVLAHLLTRASIDFLLVEAHDNVVHPAGGSFGFWPNGARILDQIGCWDDIEQRTSAIQANHVRQPDGSTLKTSRIAAKIGEEFGYDFRLLERSVPVQVLYERLPDKSKVLTKKRVVDIFHLANGVQVLFQDGSYAQGDIVVGCDGVHSTVRQIMWSNDSVISPGRITDAEKRSITTSFRCLVGVSPSIAGLGANEGNMIQGQGVYSVIMTQPQQTLFFVCIKEEKVLPWTERIRFTDKDADMEGARIADTPVTKTLRFGEIWAKRRHGYLCSLEEGILEHWYSHRTVLVGDSAHKLSPVGAQSGNCAIESAAALANALVRHLHQGPDALTTGEKLQSAFEEYQESRKPRVHRAFDSVHLMTRVGTGDTFAKRLIARYVLPRMDDTAAVSGLVREAVKADFLPVPSRSKGFVSGPQPSESACPTKEQRSGWPSVATYAILGGICILLIALGSSKRMVSSMFRLSSHRIATQA